MGVSKLTAGVIYLTNLGIDCMVSLNINYLDRCPVHTARDKHITFHSRPHLSPLFGRNQTTKVNNSFVIKIKYMYLILLTKHYSQK